MDEIKPVVFWECPLCTHLYLVRVSECDCQPGAKKFRKVKLYDQQAIATLRADYARAEELALQAIEARKEAEAEADALRKFSVASEWTDEMAMAFRRVMENPRAQWHPWPDRFRGGIGAAIDAAKQAAE